MNVNGVGMPAQLLYQTTTQNWDRQFETYKEQPTVQRSVDYFLEAVAEAETPEDLIDDYRVRTVILQAYNIDESLHNSTALLKQVLTEPLESDDALVHRMQDPRFLKMATDLRFDDGLDVIKSEEGQAILIHNYYTMGIEMDVGEQNLAVRESLYFRRSASDVETPYQILSDNALREVVFGAFNIPKEVSYQDVDKQAALIEDHVDVDRLGDEEYREEIIQRYLMNKEIETQSASSAGVLALFQPVQGYAGGAPSYQIGVNLLA